MFVLLVSLADILQALSKLSSTFLLQLRKDCVKMVIVNTLDEVQLFVELPTVCHENPFLWSSLLFVELDCNLRDETETERNFSRIQNWTKTIRYHQLADWNGRALESISVRGRGTTNNLEAHEATGGQGNITLSWFFCRNLAKPNSTTCRAHNLRGFLVWPWKSRWAKIATLFVSNFVYFFACHLWLVRFLQKCTVDSRHGRHTRCARQDNIQYACPDFSSKNQASRGPVKVESRNASCSTCVLKWTQNMYHCFTDQGQSNPSAHSSQRHWTHEKHWQVFAHCRGKGQHSYFQVSVTNYHFCREITFFAAYPPPITAALERVCLPSQSRNIVREHKNFFPARRHSR